MTTNTPTPNKRDELSANWQRAALPPANIHLPSSFAQQCESVAEQYLTSWMESEAAPAKIKALWRMYHAAVWYRSQDESLMDEAQAALLEALPAGMSAAVTAGYLPEMV